ncbi:MAG: LytR family transcriptional regulator [Firmicutes bacterium]|nr:LytR family transcriptional regulator [Bacillota bacterium]
MKHFLKVFSIAFLAFMLMVGSGLFVFTKFYNDAEAKNPDENIVNKDDKKDNEKKVESDLTPFEKAVKESKRVNILLLGLEGSRTDTIIFASFNPEDKHLDLISIPRDTYFHNKGYDAGDLRKINAKYGRSGTKGLKKAVESILGGAPIDFYVSIRYEGVERIVDALGGVEVNVPFHMVYEDTTKGKEPLYIDIPKGRQVLDGEEAVKFLRFRKSNDGKTGYSDGDLGRMKTQQQFLKSAMKKTLSLNIINVAKTAFEEVRTDMELSDILYYARYGFSMNMDNISMDMLPGSAKYKTVQGTRYSYFYHDSNKTKELIKKLYDVQEENNNNN